MMEHTKAIGNLGTLFRALQSAKISLEVATQEDLPSSTLANLAVGIAQLEDYMRALDEGIFALLEKRVANGPNQTLLHR